MSKIPTIAFSDLVLPKGGTLVLLAADGGKLGKFGQSVDKTTDGAVAHAMKAAGFKGKPGSSVEIWAPRGANLGRIVVAGIGKASELTPFDWLKFGGAVRGLLGSTGDIATAALEAPGGKDETVAPGLAAEFGLGVKLRSYRFDKYKTKKTDEDAENNGGNGISKLTIAVAGSAKARRAFAAADKVTEGVLLARDLVNEPANELGPKEFADKAKALSKLGVKVEILTEREMAKLKMAALLGVAQGSARPPRLVVMRWEGASDKRAKPVAFIGKGVVFDTGGISIKPAGGMEDMKGDMGGAAAVTGLMHALASRKARVNAVGVIGLVENMPDGKAQRPGDIVRSMSGQTIEIINTDAEGRLVLADALWYTQDRFKPKFMVDLATLTGAVIVALGKHYAGLFSNDDELSARLSAAGEATGEKVWRLPMGKEYDKQVDSKNADMKNSTSRDGSAITAAQFLKRFVNDVPWAHLDVAGTAMAAPATDISKGWAPGYGVRLLDRLVADHYEG